MAAVPLETLPLPVLRPDVELLPGPDEPDGAPTYLLHDPLRGTFDKLSWAQAEIIARLRTPTTIGAVVRQLRNTTTLRVGPEDVARLGADAAARGLTGVSAAVEPQAGEPGRPSGPATWFRRLVFLRIPLLRPDAFLERTVGAVRWLGSRPALVLYVLVGLWGLLVLAQRFDAYVATFPFFFNWQGVMAYALAIAGVKTVHEFSHAYVAKALGTRVPTMGVALIFLFPVAFADVTDSWRLRRRRQRVWIALAGVTAELVIAGFALVIWALSPPGLLHSVCFVVSSVSLVSTLLINLNPAMRYDGYYVLGDLLGIDNLQPRAFALLRWVLRRHVLGLRVASPEPGAPRGRLATLCVYAVGAWAYRLFLYSAIALMLYHRVTKAVGILLFAVAIHTFLLRPVVTEMRSLWQARRMFRGNRRAAVVLAACAGGLAWLAWPQPRWETAPAVTVARHRQVIYAPGDGVLRDVSVALGGAVRRGTPMLRVESAELAAQARLAELECARLETELSIVRGEERYRALLPQKIEEHTRATAKLESIQAALARNQVVADVDGVVVEWADGARAGTPVGTEQVLGRIVASAAPAVTCYVRHDLVGGLAVGDAVWFVSDDRPGRRAGRVVFVEGARAMAIEQRGLTSLAGGPLAARATAAGHVELLDSYYRVEVTLDDPGADLRTGQTGRVWLRTPPRSRLAELGRYVWRVVVRESSF